MAQKIGSQTGIEATRQRLNAIDPGKAAYNKLLGLPGQDYGLGAVEGTIDKLVTGHNELLDRMAAVEAGATTPFFPGSS